MKTIIEKQCVYYGIPFYLVFCLFMFIKIVYNNIPKRVTLHNTSVIMKIKSTTLSWEHNVSLSRRSQIVINRLRIEHTLHIHTHEHLMSNREQ